MTGFKMATGVQDRDWRSRSRLGFKMARRFRWQRWRTWLIRAAVASGVLSLLLVGFLLSRVEFPHRAGGFDTSTLAWLQGNGDPPELEAKNVEKVLIIGHRGSGLVGSDAGNSVIGNSANAIQAGIDQRADWIEIDLRLTKHNEVVLFHDLKVDKKTDGTGFVDELNLAQILELDLNVKPYESILTFDDFQKRFHARGRRWIFDIKAERSKTQDETKRDKLLPLILNHPQDNLILFGERSVLEQYDGYATGYERGLIVSLGANYLRFLFARTSIIRHCERLNCRYLVIPAIFAESTFVERAKEAGLVVWVYEAENAKDQKILVARGVDGLIVDFPGKARTNLGGPGQKKHAD